MNTEIKKIEPAKITKDTFKAALKEASVHGFGTKASRQGCTDGVTA
ncbi:MAG TPA: hypothetical protein VEC99_08450 [Clostridia bacterium]|nr:hypothetical protein [Clostridia bacterium]